MCPRASAYAAQACAPACWPTTRPAALKLVHSAVSCKQVSTEQVRSQHTEAEGTRNTAARQEVPAPEQAGAGLAGPGPASLISCLTMPAVRLA